MGHYWKICWDIDAFKALIICLLMGHAGKICWDIDAFGALVDLFVDGA